MCQEVCPWNEKFGQPREDLVNELFPSLLALLSLDDEGFRARFGRTALRRTKRRGLLRNVAIALGNSKNPRAIPPLRPALQDPEPLIRSHVAWALGELSDKAARTALQQQLPREQDAHVRAEILTALGEKKPPEDVS